MSTRAPLGKALAAAAPNVLPALTKSWQIVLRQPLRPWLASTLKATTGSPRCVASVITPSKAVGWMMLSASPSHPFAIAR